MEPLSIILGVSALAIGGKLLENFSLKEKKDPDVEVLENFFESVNFCNKKEESEYATVKWFKEHITYKEFGIGSGKSSLAKSIICQLIENYSPEELSLIYMDNKGGVESNLFKNIEHLSVRTKNPQQTIDALLNLKAEMFRRMALLEENDVTNLVEYNKQVSEDKKLPFILAVIDELFSFATLPSSSNNPEEAHTQKVAYRTMAEIASMCRAAGIHLMFCTQRPTNDVIPTYITCNCGIRIGLRTSTEQESRNIIEESGLELIDEESIGAGIIKTGNASKFQAFWLTDNKVKAVCAKHRGEPKKAVKNVILDEEPKNKALDWREIARGM